MCVAAAPQAGTILSSRESTGDSRKVLVLMELA